ncbi:hypothetical protein AMTRI_Chr03g43820 [Amborella trichopoda]
MRDQEGCFMEGFEITCNQSSAPPKPFLGITNIELLSVTYKDIQVNSMPFIARYCSDTDHIDSTVSLPERGPYSISNQKTVLVGIGCDTRVTGQYEFYGSSCSSTCANESSIDSGSCKGSGCCEVEVPNNMTQANVSARNLMNFNETTSFSLEGLGNLAMVVDWAIGTETCSTARSSHIPCACGENSISLDSERGYGYGCNCTKGYEGNPYLKEYWPAIRVMFHIWFRKNIFIVKKSIEEDTQTTICRPCASKDCSKLNHKDPNYKCVPQATCRNTIGSYTCKCPTCRPDNIRGCKNMYIVKEIIAGGIGPALLTAIIIWTYLAMKKMKLQKLYFEQNGGLLLLQKVSSQQGITAPRIFTTKELNKATNNFEESNVLGSGGYGTVYKGTLEDHTIVAIKKAKVVDQTQIHQFINELLGCCFETPVPMLLKKALETAEALAYLHTAACMPIFHRDVKSSNIQLDHNYTAKVADFGVSRLAPMDQNQISTLVQGTFGYLDPEYFRTGHLTAKSDVYSFGIVLLELLTGEKPVSSERSHDDANLALYFTSHLKGNHLEEILEENVLREGSIEQLQDVAELAMKCLRLRGEKRPTMKNVV